MDGVDKLFAPLGGAPVLLRSMRAFERSDAVDSIVVAASVGNMARDRAFAERGVYGVRLEARLKDGREETVEIRQPKGHPDDPFTDAELTDKISWLTERLPVPAADFPRALFEHCMSMSTKRDLERLGELLKVAEQPA